MTHLVAYLMNGLMKPQIHPGIASSVWEDGTMTGCFSFSLQAWTAFMTALKGHHRLLLEFHLIGLKMHR